MLLHKIKLGVWFFLLSRILESDDKDITKFLFCFFADVMCMIIQTLSLKEYLRKERMKTFIMKQNLGLMKKTELIGVINMVPKDLNEF